jgi:uncharacterized protein (TIGR03435 family)
MRNWSYAGTLFLIAAVTIARLAAETNNPNAQFEAASVKLVDANMRGSHTHSQSDPRRLSFSGTMHVFVMHAYGITKDQLAGEPPWFKTQLYSIEAVTTTPASEDEMKPMLRNLLADRFQLKLREEQREQPVFLLQVDRNGPKFPKLTGRQPPEKNTPPGVTARSFTTIEDLVRALNGASGGVFTLDRKVVDQTNLTGSYDIQIVTDVERQTGPDGQLNPQFPNLLHDLQSQLGLKLVASRENLPYFTVEHSTQPGPN